MRVHIFGTLSGTEPKAGRHHTSWALELDNGDLYWFDAGENGPRSAYLMGLDLFRLKAVFISHSHIDHTGGILNLFGVIHKMRGLTGDATPRKIDLYLPRPDIAGPLMKLLDAFHCTPAHTEIVSRTLNGGGVFDDGAVKVEFLANGHIRVPEGEKPESFSFRITSGGRTIISSGDVRSVEELVPWCRQGADLILMESGHHSPPLLCARWRELACPLKRIVFLHHGREYLNFPQETLRKCRNAWSGPVIFADDRTTLEL